MDMMEKAKYDSVSMQSLLFGTHSNFSINVVYWKGVNKFQYTVHQCRDRHSHTPFTTFVTLANALFDSKYLIDFISII